MTNRPMVFWENSSNRSWNKVKSLNVSFQKYLHSVVAHSVTQGKGLSRSCLPNCASLGQVSLLQNSMTERERAQKHMHEETMPVEAYLHRGSSTCTCRSTRMMSNTPGPNLAPLHDKANLEKAYGQCYGCTGPMPKSFQGAMGPELLNSGGMPEAWWVSALGGEQCRAGASYLIVKAVWSGDVSPELSYAASLSSVAAALSM